MITHRPIVMSDAGMVVSGHHKASEAGATVLRDGGNAIDAAVAASAVLAVAIPHMNGLGGDAIALHRDARSGRTFAINGSGCAPRSLSPQVVLEAGHERMPMRGPFSVSIPGLVHAWEAVLAQFGTRPLATLLGPAIALAGVGVPLDPVLTEYFNGRDYERLASEFPALSQLYGAPGDRRLGVRLRNPALSGTLAEIASGGAATFYSGDIGRRLLADIRKQGVRLDADDFASHQTLIGEPLSVAFAGRRLHVAPPNSQGIALAIMAGLTDLKREEAGSVPPVRPADFLARKQRAFGSREEIDDCSLRSGPLPELTRAYLRGLSQVACPAARSSTHGGDTSTLVVLDGRGNAVSWVQSLFEDFGSGIVSPSTGIVMHNRLSLQGLRPDEPWPLRGGRRPFHTLCPAILETRWALRDDARYSG